MSILVRVEVRPGVVLKLTPAEAQAWREERDRERAVAAAVEIIQVVQPAPTLPRIDCGVVLTRPSEHVQARLSEMGLPVALLDDTRIAHERTLLWDPSAALRLDLVPAGFHLITAFAWQIVVPLWSYTELARDIGTPEDRERTERVIRDLRVPVYDPRVLFLRHCEESDRLMETWRREQQDGGEDRLAFLRALYQVQPLVCALPAAGTWVGQ